MYDKDKTDKKVRHVLSGIEYYIFNKALRSNIDREARSTIQTHEKSSKLSPRIVYYLLIPKKLLLTFLRIY